MKLYGNKVIAKMKKHGDFNIVSSVFGKRGTKIVDWLNKGLATYINKEKIQTLINQQRTILADVEYLDLDSAAKVIENFVNPKLSVENLQGRDENLYRTSTELDSQYPTWLSGQTTDTGQHTTQITSTVKSYQHIGDWMKAQGMEGAKVLDASSGLGVGTQAMRDMGFDVDDVEPYPSENRTAPTFLRYEDIDKKYDVVISNAVLNVILQPPPSSESVGMTRREVGAKRGDWVKIFNCRLG